MFSWLRTKAAKSKAELIFARLEAERMEQHQRLIATATVLNMTVLAAEREISALKREASR